MITWKDGQPIVFLQSMNANVLTTRPEPVLIRLPNWVGDVCMVLPALDLLEQHRVPYALCGRSWARSLLAGKPITGFVPMTDSVLGNMRSVKLFLSEHPNYRRGLLLPDSLSSALSFRLAGLKCAGWRDDGRSLLLRWGFNKPSSDRHAVESWLDVTQRALIAWGVDVATEAPANRLRLPIAKHHEQAAVAAMKEAGLNSGEFVLIAPTATGRHKGQSKVWPHFDAFTRVLQNNKVTVAMCPPNEEVDSAFRTTPTATQIRPLELGAFCALTRHAKLVICNDSGVSHLCAAAVAKQITLFGVTDPARTGPWSPDAVLLGTSSGWPQLGETIARVQQLLSTTKA